MELIYVLEIHDFPSTVFQSCTWWRHVLCRQYHNIIFPYLNFERILSIATLSMSLRRIVVMRKPKNISQSTSIELIVDLLISSKIFENSWTFPEFKQSNRFYKKKTLTVQNKKKTRNFTSKTWGESLEVIAVSTSPVV